MFGAALFRACQGMTAHENHAGRHLPFQTMNDESFSAAGVGQEAAGLAAGCTGQNLFHYTIDRGAEDGHVCLGHTSAQINDAFVDGADRQGSVEAALLPADAKNALARPRCLAARPMEPPIRPTPMMVRVCIFMGTIGPRLLAGDGGIIGRREQTWFRSGSCPWRTGR